MEAVLARPARHALSRVPWGRPGGVNARVAVKREIEYNVVVAPTHWGAPDLLLDQSRSLGARQDRYLVDLSHEALAYGHGRVVGVGVYRSIAPLHRSFRDHLAVHKELQVLALECERQVRPGVEPDGGIGGHVAHSAHPRVHRALERLVVPGQLHMVPLRKVPSLCTRSRLLGDHVRIGVRHPAWVDPSLDGAARLSRHVELRRAVLGLGEGGLRDFHATLPIHGEGAAVADLNALVWGLGQGRSLQRNFCKVAARCQRHELSRVDVPAHVGDRGVRVMGAPELDLEGGATVNGGAPVLVKG